MNTLVQFTEFAVQQGCTELYEVVKTVEVAHGHDIFRFEAVRNMLKADKGFDVRVSRKEEKVWEHVHAAWIDRDSVEGALMQSFSFFFGRNRNSQ